MRRLLTVIGTLIGVTASVVAGVGAYQLARVGFCSADCPSGLWMYGLGLPVAMLLLGVGAGIVVIALPGALGVGLLAGGRSATDHVVGGVLLAVSVGLVALRLHHPVRETATAGGIATVLESSETEDWVAEGPVVRLRVRMAPVDDTRDFEATGEVVVPTGYPPRFGQRYTASYDPANHNRFLLHAGLAD